MIIEQINKLLNILGNYLLFLFITLKTLIKEGCNKSFLLKQIEHLGINSIIICVVTGGFSGAVMALQSYKGFQQFGGHHLIGMIVALTLTRELGPVLTGLMVAGRVGAGIASEIGSMKVTEQIDALQVLHINPIRYLVLPRILATIIVVPCLALFATLCGIWGGYLVSTKVLDINGHQFIQSIRDNLSLYDVFGCLIKSAVFGLIISWIGTYKGFNATGGAQGVGKATTKTVVVSSILIIISNYFLALLLFGP